MCSTSSSTVTGGPLIGPVIDAFSRLPGVPRGRARLSSKASWQLVYNTDAFTRYQNAILCRPDLPPRGPLPAVLLSADLAADAAAVRPAGRRPRPMRVFMAATAARGDRAGRTTRPGGAGSPFWSRRPRPGSMLAGQNTFLSIALLYGGFRLLDRAPGSRRHPARAAAPTSRRSGCWCRSRCWPRGNGARSPGRSAPWSALALASLAVFGLDFWLAFFDAARDAGSRHRHGRHARAHDLRR